MADRRPRLRDVAERAHVSLGTASNAFNRPELLSDALRDRVQKAARELGYAGPDPAARRLRTGRAGAIGLVFTLDLVRAFADEAATRFLRGVAEGIEGAGAGLLLIPTSPSLDEAARVVRDAVVDGFVVYSVADDDPRRAAAIARGIPVVTVDQPLDGATPFVGIDDRAGARAAAEHVRALGHERVVILSFVDEADDRLPFAVTRERLAGYREGLGRDARILHVLPSTAERAYEIALQALDAPEPPSAILAMSDALAFGALQAAAERDLDVPRDLSVVGFDDSPPAAGRDLTTVAQPIREKGQRAAELLLGGGDERVLLATELVVRGSTSTPGR